LKVTGKLTSLPGNPPIVKGPGYAKNVKPAGSSAAVVEAAPVPTLSYSSGVSIAPSEPSAYVPGAVFAAIPSADTSSEVAVNIAAVETPAAKTPAPKAPEPTPTPSPSQDTDSFFSTQYITNGFTVSEIFWAEELITVTLPVTTTSTATAAVRAKRHIHKHRREN